MKKKLKNKSGGAPGASFPRRAFAICIAWALIGCSGGNHTFTPEQLVITPDLAKATKSPNEVVLASISTIRPAFRSMGHSIKANGVVTYDTRRIYSIPARVAGRLEKVYLKYAYQRVDKGDRIAEIYSPELMEAQRELLFLFRSDPANNALIAASKKKLQLLGLSSSQIEALITRKEVLRTVAIFSPYTGYLMPQGEVPPSIADRSNGESAIDDMENGTANTSVSGSPTHPVRESSLREGSYVSAGQTLFRIADTRALRIDLSLPASTAGAVKSGDELELMVGNGKKRKAVAEVVQPFFNEGENFSRVRVYVQDANDLQIGQLVESTINLKGTESLWLPKEAVLDLGTRQVVFVKEHGLLKPRTVVTGVRTGEMVEIRNGLATMEDVAADAHFLVDSESFVKPLN